MLDSKEKSMLLHLLFCLKGLCNVGARRHLGLDVHSVPRGAGQVTVASITVVVWQWEAVVVMPASGVQK